VVFKSKPGAAIGSVHVGIVGTAGVATLESAAILRVKRRAAPGMQRIAPTT
jgi:hypothetical protein